MGTFNPQDYQKRLFDECRSANWDPQIHNTFAEEIAHLHEELSEAFRAWRQHRDFKIRVDESGKPQGVPVEFADVLIGLFYNAELHGFDLFAAVEQKHQFNLTRDYVLEGRQLHAESATTVEVQRRADAVADAAIAWHESGQIGHADDWFRASEELTTAIEHLLELRTPAERTADS